MSQKQYPEDIDLCFDLTGVDEEKIRNVFSQFFEPNEIGKIHRDLQCHILYFFENFTRYFDLFQENREGNLKGLVRLEIKNILDSYDQK